MFWDDFVLTLSPTIMFQCKNRDVSSISFLSKSLGKFLHWTMNMGEFWVQLFVFFLVLVSESFSRNSTLSRKLMWKPEMNILAALRIRFPPQKWLIWGPKHPCVIQVRSPFHWRVLGYAEHKKMFVEHTGVPHGESFIAPRFIRNGQEGPLVRPYNN